VISVMDNFSRATLASDIYQAQGLASVLIVLYAAIEQHGCPQRLVTDIGTAMTTATLLQRSWDGSREKCAPGTIAPHLRCD
jgi:hypothetical protein